MSISLRATAAVVLVAGATALTGCSGTSGSGSAASTAAKPTSSAAAPSRASSSSPNAGAVVKASLAAARTAKTVRLAGAGTDSGAPVALDIHYGNNGAAGSVTMSGSKIQLIILGATVYFKAPDAFYRKQAGKNAVAVIKLIGGKWVRVPVNSTTGSDFGQLADRQKLIDSFASGLSASDAANLRRVGSGNVAGVPTTTYSDGSGQGSIDVAASGTPYPMKLVSKGSSSGTLTFTDWNKPFTVTAPPASQTARLPS